MEAYCWQLYWHRLFEEEIIRLEKKVKKLAKKDPKRYKFHAKTKLLAAIFSYIYDIVPSDPFKAEYRLGNTLSPENRNWRRITKGLRRYRLFFQVQSKNIEPASQESIKGDIVYAWINDKKSMRKDSEDSKSDVYKVFEKKLNNEVIASEFNELKEQSKVLPQPRN